MKLLDVMWKAILLSLLCAVFFNARSYAVVAPGETKIKESTNSAIQKAITGKVIDENGQPLIGATVSVKGTTIGTITDAFGKYSLSVPEDATVLVFSYIGYAPEEVTIGNSLVIDVSLAPDALAITEVVVVGYGNLKKSDLTGSVSSVKGSDLTRLPGINATESLQGIAAGVVINNNDGAPGGNTTIRIRGSNTVAGSSNPLVVVDGFQGGDLDKINPNDIANIEVLKDASATAIYGSRGANGVIIVTTKHGTAGAPIIDYNYSYGMQNVTKRVAMMSAGDYARTRNAWAASQNGDLITPLDPVLPFTEAQIAELDKTGGTNWQDEILKKGYTNTHQFSIRGGTEKIRYFISGGMMNQKGVLINTNFKRLSLRSNVDADLKKWLKVGLNLNIVKDDGNIPSMGDGTYNGHVLGQAINQALRADPTMPVKNPDGSWGTPNALYSDPEIWNPVATTYTQTKDLQNRDINANSYFEFKLLPALTFRVEGALGLGFENSWEYYSSQNRFGSEYGGYGIINEGNSQYFQNSNLLIFDKTFSENHHVILTTVAEQQYSKGDYLYNEAIGFASDITGVNNIGGASSFNAYGSSVSERKMNSYMGRAFYSYKNKYMLTASFRADGSSVFGIDNKWGFFPAISLGWDASKEDFVRDLDVFSELKLRASIGQTGNQSLAPYQTLASINPGGKYDYDGLLDADNGYSVGLENANLKWEATTQSNLGVDMGFLDDRLTLTVDVYSKHTTDLLFAEALPTYTGFTSRIANIGSLKNEGLEISGGGYIFNGDFKWKSSGNIAFNQSEMLSMEPGVTIMPIKTNTGSGYGIWADGPNNALMNFEIGKPMGLMRGWKNLGIWGTDEAAQAAVFKQMPGDIKYLDVNRDSIIDENDLTTIGNSSPKFVWGWSNTLSYKGFTLTCLIQGSQGNDVFNATRIMTENPMFGYSETLNDRWTPENQNTIVPAISSTQDRDRAGGKYQGNIKITAAARNRQSRYVEDGSYARLKNITLSYDIPVSIIKKVHISAFRVYLSASNIYTLTKYSGYDPEINSFTRQGNYGGKGIDMSGYPTAKTFSIGANLTF